MSMQRPKVTKEVLEEAVSIVMDGLSKRLDQKGDSAFVSIHEMLGITTEEYNEMAEAVHQNDEAEVNNEAVDVAVAAIWSIASMLTLWNERSDND